MKKGNKDKEVFCDNCRFKFKIELETEFLELVNEKEEREMIPVRFFRCPNCNTGYFVSAISKGIKSKIKKINKFATLIMKNPDNPFILSANNQKIEDIKKEISFAHESFREQTFNKINSYKKSI